MTNGEDRSANAPRRRPRGSLPVAVVAAVAVTAAVVVGVLGWRSGRGPGTALLGTAGSGPADVAPGATSSPRPPAGTFSASVPVYYVGAGGATLYREYHQVRVTPDSVGGRIAAAVTEMLRLESSADPDYTTLWPAGVVVRGARLDAGVITVDLGTPVGGTPVGGAPVGGAPVGGAPVGGATLAIEQLVWTATAVVADVPGVSAEQVRILVDGAAPGILGGIQVAAQPLRRAASTSVLAPLWLVEPQHGAAVGERFTVNIAGTVPEAAARLRIRSAAGALVSDVPVVLDAAAPGRGEVRLEVTLAPGRYTVETFFVAARDGSVQGVDDHEITVR